MQKHLIIADLCFTSIMCIMMKFSASSRLCQWFRSIASTVSHCINLFMEKELFWGFADIWKRKQVSQFRSELLRARIAKCFSSCRQFHMKRKTCKIISDCLVPSRFRFRFHVNKNVAYAIRNSTRNQSCCF